MAPLGELVDDRGLGGGREHATQDAGSLEVPEAIDEQVRPDPGKRLEQLAERSGARRSSRTRSNVQRSPMTSSAAASPERSR